MVSAVPVFLVRQAGELIWLEIIRGGNPDKTTNRFDEINCLNQLTACRRKYSGHCREAGEGLGKRNRWD